jgi:hypothetical protein
MKLITEVTQELNYLTEDKDGRKNVFIEGIFMQSNKENRNGRIYPKNIIEKEVERYQNIISSKRSLGELGHPTNPTINLNTVSHLITKLKLEGDNVIGRAKILDTPMGKIAKNFIEEGVSLGVSSRGLGSLKEKNGIMEVQNDFYLATIDIVADPSAPDAFVQGIMENEDWILNNGIWTKIQVDTAKNIIRKTSSKNLEEKKLKMLESFFTILSRK